MRWLGEFRSTVFKDVKAMAGALGFRHWVTVKRSFCRIGCGDTDKSKPWSASSESRKKISASCNPKDAVIAKC